MSVCVTTEADLLHLLRKEREVVEFALILEELKKWDIRILGWLTPKPQRVLELKSEWRGICAVVTYLLQEDVSGKYVRSLAVPVHTKFIQENSAIILSLLKHMDPSRFSHDTKDLEAALGLQKKPILCTLRWLDQSFADMYSSGLPFLAAPIRSLQTIKWPVQEVWVVENETNLYLIPPRDAAMAIFSKGYALHELKEISMLRGCRLLYWGDLDEDGFRMLHQFRQLYPHTESILMDEVTVLEHLKEIHQVPFSHLEMALDLTSEEENAWQIIKEKGGRIEQEKIRQDWMLKKIVEVDIVPNSS